VTPATVRPIPPLVLKKSEDIVRIEITVFAVIVCLAAPMSVEAGPPRGGLRGFRQPQAYRKKQTITPENPDAALARQQHLDRLKTDLDAIAPRSTPTDEQKTALYQDLVAVVDGSSKPAPSTVKQLSADLATLMSGRGQDRSFDTQKLARDLKVVMNSAYLTSTAVHSATRASQELLKSSGAADPAAQAIVNDLKTISTQAAAQGRPGMIR
jgi:hypothetical protein